MKILKWLVLLIPVMMFAQARADTPIVKKTWVYAKDFGLVGDSTTDDETKFETMLSRANPGWTIVLDSGKVYRVTDSVTVPEYVTIEGRGAKVCFEVDSTQGGFFMKNYSALKNMTVVTYNKANAFPSTVHGGMGTAITIGEYDNNVGYKGVVVENVEAISYRPDGNVMAIFSNSYADFRNVKILKNDSCAIGVMAHWAGGATTYHPSVKWDGGIIDTLNNDAVAILVSAPGYVDIKNIDILAAPIAVKVQAGDSGYIQAAPVQIGTGITFTNIRSFADSIGFWVNGTSTALSDTAALPVTFINCYTRGTNSWGAYASGIRTEHCKNVSFYGCEITNHSYGFSDGNGYGLNTTFRDCIFHNNRTRGINAEARTTEGLLVEHCRFFNNGVDGNGIGIYIGRATNAMLFANEIGDYNAELYQITGIYVDNLGTDSNKVAVIANHCRGYKTAGYCFRVDDIDNLTWWQGNLVDTNKLNYASPSGITLKEGTIIHMGKRIWPDDGSPGDNQVPTWDAGLGVWAFETPPGAGGGDDVKFDTSNGTIWDLSTVIFKEGNNINIYKKAGYDTVFVAASDSVMAADSAGKASQDGAGNSISSTYMPLSGGTFTGDPVFNSGVDLGSSLYPVDTIFGDYLESFAKIEVDTILMGGVYPIISLWGWGLKYNSSNFYITADSSELDNGMATDAEMTTHTGTASAHHTRPSAGTGMTEVANAFNVDLGTAITTGEITDSNVTGIKIASAVWDSIRVGYTGGSSPWTIAKADSIYRLFAVGDTLWMSADTVNDSIHIWASHGNLILGSVSLSVFDSIQVYNLIRWGSGADTCTIGYAVIDSIYHQTGRFAAGSGDITGVTAGVLITGGGESGTVTINADTGVQSGAAGLATKPFVRDSGTGLDYTTETDSGVWSVFAPISPNTGVKLSGSVIVGDPGLAEADSLAAYLLYLQSEAGATDSLYYISTQDISDGEHCLYYVTVATGPDSVYWGNCTGGSGWNEANAINDTMIDWGTGDNQVSTDDMTEGSVNLYEQYPNADVTGITAGTGISVSGVSGEITVGITAGGVGTTQLAENAVTPTRIDALGDLVNYKYFIFDSTNADSGLMSKDYNNKTFLTSTRDDTTGFAIYMRSLYLHDLSGGLPGIYFNDNAAPPYSRAFRWDTTDDRFELNDSLWIDGNLIITGKVDTVDVAALADSYWGHDHAAAYAPITPDSTEIDTANIREWVADKIGGMVTGNTETGIAVTYDDADNTLDFVAEVTQAEFDAVCDDSTALIAAKDSVAVWDNGVRTPFVKHNDSSISWFLTDTALIITVDDGVTHIHPGQNTTLVIGDTTGPTLIDSATIGGQYVDHTDSILSKVQADALYETITNVGKIGDDTTALIAAKDSVAAWDNGVLVSQTTFDKVCDDTTAWNASTDARPDIGDTINARMTKAVTGNTETGIAVTYEAGDSTYDFVAEVTQAELDAVCDDTTALIAAKDSVAAWDNGVLVSQTTFDKIADDTTALIAAKDSVAAWDNNAVFLLKTGGDVDSIKVDTVIVDDKIVIPNATNPTTAVKGTIAIDNDDHAIEVYDSGLAASVLNTHLEYKGFTITSPDAVADTTTVLHVGDYIYPFGIKILKLELITNDSVGTYALQFEEWTGKQNRSRSAYIDTLTVLNDSSYTSSITFTDSDIAAGNQVRVIVPATPAIDEISGWITFYIKEGD